MEDSGASCKKTSVFPTQRCGLDVPPGTVGALTLGAGIYLILLYVIGLSNPSVGNMAYYNYFTVEVFLLIQILSRHDTT